MVSAAASLVKDATVVTGLDAMTIPRLHRLTAAGRPSSVVVIEPDHSHPLLDEAWATGAQIVVADPRSEQGTCGIRDHPECDAGQVSQQQPLKLSTHDGWAADHAVQH
jgi:hypothetical protein